MSFCWPFRFMKEDRGKGKLVRSHDESPSGPVFGAECTTLSPVVDVTYQTANASKKGADIDAGHVAVASKFCSAAGRKGCYERPNWEIASRGVRRRFESNPHHRVGRRRIQGFNRLPRGNESRSRFRTRPRHSWRGSTAVGLLRPSF